MALIGGVIRNANTHTTLTFANACITGTFDCASTDGYGVWNAVWGYEGVSITHSAGGFSPKTLNYTTADVAFFPAYGQNGYWKVVELTPEEHPPNSCFAGHTLVQMADGSTKPIAEVMIGDYVLGQGGALNRVIGLERPLLQERKLYAINRGAPFVTQEHPFLSNSGWKAIDPAALKLENAMLPAKRLAIGDSLLVAHAIRVLEMAGGMPDRPEFDIQEVKVTSLVGHPADPNSIVFNLLLDGDHTYIANGFIVHNKGSH